MYSIGERHGRVYMSFMAVVKDAKTNQIRGKLMNFCIWKDIKINCHYIAAMISHNIIEGKFDVNESHEMEMK